MDIQRHIVHDKSIILLAQTVNILCKYIHSIHRLRIYTPPQDSQYYQGRLMHQLLSLCSSPLRQKIQTLVSMYHQIQKQLFWTLEQTALPHGDPYTYFF